MALIDDINALPTTVGDGQTGHLNNHSVIHSALKDHETRLGARHLIGTGSPDGRITATIGTQYTDQAATNGAIRWIKTSGTAATGWRVEYGDTGWRSITSDLQNGWAASAVEVRRVNEQIYFRVRGLIGTSSTNRLFVNIPSGFRPNVISNVRFPEGPDETKPLYMQISTTGNGTLLWLTIPHDNSYGVSEVSWSTGGNPPWPTSLPGTPA